MDETRGWLDLWRGVSEEDAKGSRRLIGDVCSGIRLVTDDDGPDDPDEVIAMAIAGAEAAEATADGLDREWALYTPQQAAVVASALFAQIEAAGTALEKLSEYLHIMDARQDVVIPEFNDSEHPNLNDAEMGLGGAGQEARATAVAAERTVRALAETPYLGRLPAHAHETITAVAELLGSAATLCTDHHVQDEVELAENYDSGFGCGCSIALSDNTGSPWEFRRGDSSWNLVRLADVGDDGVLRSWVDLDASEACAHPGHLAALIRECLPAGT
ncbi:MULTISPECIES: hypothetical protein [Streptomyces]|uniref:Uncharacterized protein n=1 Tax=Streptomyces mordarskii TaxID=1226758 RepID=A0ABN1D568_9ACTN